MAIQIITTVNTEDSGRHLATLLVDRRLAACVQIVPGIKSIYRWKGKIEEEQEVQLIIKSRENLYKAVEQVILENHPYECPEILSIPVLDGYGEYLAWLEENVQ